MSEHIPGESTLHKKEQNMCTDVPFRRGNTARTEPDTDDMVIIHRLFRRELRLLGPMIDHVAPGDVKQATKVGRHASLVLDFLDNHHRGEDALLWPILAARAQAVEELLARMEDQHDVLATSIAAIRGGLSRWVESASSGDRARLVEQCHILSTALTKHLDEEELRILPLARALLSVAEWNRLAEHGSEATPPSKSTALLLLGAILEDADDGERQRFLATVPLPARLAWRVVGQRNYQSHILDLRAGIH